MKTRPPTPEISLAQIRASGYTEDLESKRAFEGRYSWITLPAVLMIFLPLPLAALVFYLHIPLSSRWALLGHPRFFLGSMLAGVILGVGAGVHAMFAVPTSRRSGAPMRRFSRSDAPKDTREYIYLDETSRTFFTRVATMPSSDL